MAEFILKDRNGKGQTFNTDAIFVQGTDGELVQFTQGTGSGSDVTLLEGLSFELDFSNGDMPFAAPNGYAVKSAIVKKPAALIPANIKSGVEVAGITGTLSGGANPDANDPVYYVTFMNGDQVLYVRPVVSGDTCPDVVSKGWAEKPTKESTERYHYYQNGWSDTDGGSAISGILQNISSDKTVYAAFTAYARSYTITYYDSDGTTVLKTESLAYGATPAYTPVKSGYAFQNWTPAPTAVTGDASYTASWVARHPEEAAGYALVLPTVLQDVSYSYPVYKAAACDVWEEIIEGAQYKVTYDEKVQALVTATKYIIYFKKTSGTGMSSSTVVGFGDPSVYPCSTSYKYDYVTNGNTGETLTPAAANYFVVAGSDATTGNPQVTVYYRFQNGVINNNLTQIIAQHKLKIQRVLEETT